MAVLVHLCAITMQGLRVCALSSENLKKAFKFTARWMGLPSAALVYVELEVTGTWLRRTSNDHRSRQRHRSLAACECQHGLNDTCTFIIVYDLWKLMCKERFYLFLWELVCMLLILLFITWLRAHMVSCCLRHLCCATDSFIFWLFKRLFWTYCPRDWYIRFLEQPIYLFRPTSVLSSMSL